MSPETIALIAETAESIAKMWAIAYAAARILGDNITNIFTGKTKP